MSKMQGLFNVYYQSLTYFIKQSKSRRPTLYQRNRGLDSYPRNMARGKPITEHPQIDLIRDLIMAGRPVRYIASTVLPSISPETVQQYRTKLLKPAVSSVTKSIKAKVLERLPGVPVAVVQDTVQELKKADLRAPFLERLAKREKRREPWFDLVENEADVRGFTALEQSERADMEFEAKLVGVTDQPASNQPVNILVVLPTAPAPLESGRVIDVHEV